MEKGKSYQNMAIRMLKSLLSAYIITGVLLLFLALLLFKFQLSEARVNIGIIIVYVISSFLGGFLEGKMMKARKFLWGAAAGLLYFAILALISLAVNQGFGGGSSHFVTTLILCTAGGTLGGMVS
ncbi:MAG: TIGR04086 family membrane protein [Lachnospiraceae bacterium]|jgi:putative membrane protein (TIGR04086 family)|nr:TIGR04086 family membrane protein [Lachnospiraceae bacterium]